MAIDKNTIGALFAVINSAQSAADALAGVRRDVREARRIGATWSEIGNVLNMSGEAARQKFGDGTPVVVRAKVGAAM